MEVATSPRPQRHQWKVKRMKPARIAVLAIALLAGGIAAFLAGRSDPTPPAPAPVAQIETVDILIANVDIGMGHAISDQELRWQTWPTAAAGPNFIRRGERPDAIEQLAGAIARQIIGTTVIGGIVAETFIGRFFVPVIFYVVEKFSGAKQVSTTQFRSAEASGEAD